MTTVPQFLNLLNARASDAVYHRADSLIPCPCRTPEGFRNLAWHRQHPEAQICNEQGYLYDPANTKNFTVKAFIQPIQSTRATRLNDEVINAIFGEVQSDDHLGIFPIVWSGERLDFYEWGRAGEDYIVYNTRRFTVVNANLIPDPSDGNPEHHWEVGMRLISKQDFT